MSPTITRHAPLPAAAATDAPLLELDDIQGFVLRGNAYPHARYVFLRFGDRAAARRFVGEVTPRITDSHLHESGRKKPYAINLAFTWRGLAALGIPARSLESFPPEFREGMRARAAMLHDTGSSDPELWDPVWRAGDVHAWYAIHSRQKHEVGHRDVLIEEYEWLERAAAEHDVSILGSDDAGMLFIDGKPSNKEHFGYSDGFSNPDIAGSGWPSIPGGGKPDGKGNWTPIAAGEVVLGQRDEAGELPVAPLPVGLARNGTYLVYRKLEERVYSFRRWLDAEAERFPGGKELLAAKLVGRWRDGTPLVRYPGPDGHPVLDDRTLGHFTDYVYGDDPEGARCPMGAHTRRVNPRDALGFDGTLVNRHRIVRRGLNYGEWVPEGRETPADDTGKGVVFMVIGASIERQFEFVQREWVNYGNDFLQGNDGDPIIGNHDGGGRMLIQGDAALGGGNGNGHAAAQAGDGAGAKRRTPWICANLPQFTVTRGGDYFFMPSLTALRLIAGGRVERS